MESKKIFNKKTYILLVFDILIINMAYFLALYLRFDGSFIQIPKIYLQAFKNYALINTIITLIPTNARIKTNKYGMTLIKL